MAIPGAVRQRIRQPRLGREVRPATPSLDKVDSEEGRRDPCGTSATEEEERWRVCYGQIEQLAKELEMPRGAFSYVG